MGNAGALQSLWSLQSLLRHHMFCRYESFLAHDERLGLQTAHTQITPSYSSEILVEKQNPYSHGAGQTMRSSGRAGGLLCYSSAAREITLDANARYYQVLSRKHTHKQAWKHALARTAPPLGSERSCWEPSMSGRGGSNWQKLGDCARLAPLSAKFPPPGAFL